MKYIIEIKPEYEDSFKGLMILGAKDSNLFVDTLGVENLEELNSDYINEHYGSLQDEAYKRGINDGSLDVKQRVEGAYQRGLDDAWKCMKKIAFLEKPRDMRDFLGHTTFGGILTGYTAAEAIAKLKAYEEKQKADEDVKRGDILRNKTNGLTYIVTLASDYGYVLLGNDGNCATTCITNTFEKTGKHFDIDKILDEMKK